MAVLRPLLQRKNHSSKHYCSFCLDLAYSRLLAAIWRLRLLQHTENRTTEKHRETCVSELIISKEYMLYQLYYVLWRYCTWVICSQIPSYFIARTSCTRETNLVVQIFCKKAVLHLSRYLKVDIIVKANKSHWFDGFLIAVFVFSLRFDELADSISSAITSLLCC